MSDEALGRTLTAAAATILIIGSIALVAYCTIGPAHGETSQAVKNLDMTEVSAARRHRRYRFRVHRARRTGPAAIAVASKPLPPVEQIEPECCWPKLEPVDWIVARWPDNALESRAEEPAPPAPIVQSRTLTEPLPGVVRARAEPWGHTAAGIASIVPAVLVILGALGLGLFKGLRTERVNRVTVHS